MCEFEFDESSLTSGFHEAMESRLELVDEQTARIIERVRSLPCARQDLEEVSLALSEALANAVIHGNREDPGKKVQICGACESQDQLVLVITDEGDGFDPAAIPDPTLADNLFSNHGRGVFLIQRLMDQAEFRLGGRQIVLRKRIP